MSAQTDAVPDVTMAWPFLFCQKPIVWAPVLVLQTVTDAEDACSRPAMVAVLLKARQVAGAGVVTDFE